MTALRERGTAWLNRKTAVLEALTAIFLLTSAVLTYVTVSLQHDNATLTSDRAALISANAELELQLQTVNAELSARDSIVATLRADIEELRTLVPYSVAPEDVPSIRAAATVTLSENGDSIDLNSTSPNFDAGDQFYVNDSLRYSGEALRLTYNVSALRLRTGTAEYATCAAATGYARESELEPHLLTEPSTCLRLASDRYATIQVLRMDEQSVDVAIVVWE